MGDYLIYFFKVLYKMKFSWFKKTFVKRVVQTAFRKAVAFILSQRWHVKERVFPKQILTSGIHEEDVALEEGEGLRTQKQTKSSEAIDTPNNLPLHFMLSFSQC